MLGWGRCGCVLVAVGSLTESLSVLVEGTRLQGEGMIEVSHKKVSSADKLLAHQCVREARK
jgi:hypothetical protein